MFDFGEDDPLSDQALVRAARKRLLAEIERKEAQSAIVNNVYGSGGGVSERLGINDLAPPAAGEDDPYGYYVDIIRRDLADKDPDTGKPVGWEKKVHRYAKKKAE